MKLGICIIVIVVALMWVGGLVVYHQINDKLEEIELKLTKVESALLYGVDVCAICDAPTIYGELRDMDYEYWVFAKLCEKCNKKSDDCLRIIYRQKKQIERLKLLGLKPDEEIVSNSFSDWIIIHNE